jgi:hypothetical protein
MFFLYLHLLVGYGAGFIETDNDKKNKKKNELRE